METTGFLPRVTRQLGQRGHTRKPRNVVVTIYVYRPKETHVLHKRFFYDEGQLLYANTGVLHTGTATLLRDVHLQGRKHIIPVATHRRDVYSLAETALLLLQG